MKKLSIIFMVALIFFMPIFNTFNQQTAHANIISKPLTITAKKVAKDLAQNTAVEMAEHILFEKAMAEFLDSDKTDPGYKAVCLDGSKPYDDCAPNKRAQIKENLTSTDKAALSSKVETVLERKTNTSSKWTKFLDWFIPIFLISGLVATFDSIMNPDSEGLIDEIAVEALTESGLLKALSIQPPVQEDIYDFTDIIERISFTFVEGSNRNTTTLNLHLKPNKTLDMEFINRDGQKESYTFNTSPKISVPVYKAMDWSREKEKIYTMKVLLNLTEINGNPRYLKDTNMYVTPELANESATRINANNWATTNIHNYLVANIENVNDVMHKYKSLVDLTGANVTFNVNKFKPVQPIIIIEPGVQPGIEKLKNPDGTVKTPGIEKFKYTHGQNEIYPSPASTTGWKEKTTGEDIAVVEEEIAVDTEIGAPSDTKEEEEEFPSCSKKLDKIKFNKVGNAFTNAFPFSIPWDIKRFIDASFGTVGDAKPSFKLPEYLGGVKLEIPDYFDSWMGFMRSFVLIGFDITLIYFFYRIMKGSGD